ncbi:MAG: oligosaccharide flippase family protein [Bacteroidales bacterium]|nr:oligosaccharide flippase family protein [Bacteroidales bacterium]
MKQNSLLINLFFKVNMFFFTGNERTKKVKKNITLSFIIKGIDIIIGILLVPLILGYLDQTRYGIWLTLSSFVMWFVFFDVGLGHGLRNKLSEALAVENINLAKKYISTAYTIITIISITFLTFFLIVNTFLDWSLLLNTEEVSPKELKLLAIIIFGFFSFRFIFKLINSILYAKQKPAFVNMITTLAKLIQLLIIYILLHTTKGSLLYLGITFSVTPVLVLILFSFIFFSISFKDLSPKIKYVDFGLFKDLFSLGGKFFIIQIAAVVLYSTDNMIITHLFSPTEVTPYQIAHRYFGMIMIVMAIVVTPFWSAITEAYKKGELGWIKRSIKKLVQIWSIIFCVLLIMLLFSGKVYQLWIGDRVAIPFALSAAWALFVAILSLNTIFVHFINGTGKVKLQMSLAIIAALLNIPLSILLAKYFHMGVVGVISATIITQVIGIFFVIIQYHKIIQGDLHGIWGK